jgi:hypothetical protein
MTYAAHLPPPADDVHISNGRLYIPVFVDETLYSMLFTGMRNSSVDNIIIRNDSPFGIGPTFREATLPGWTDSHGVEVDDTARSRNNRISRIQSIGSSAVAIEQTGTGAEHPGYFEMEDCRAGADGKSHRVFSVGARVGTSNRSVDSTGGAFKNVEGYCVPEAGVLFTGTCAVAANVSNKAKSNNVSRFYPRRKGLLTGMKMTYDQALTAGTVTIALSKNGVSDGADGFPYPDAFGNRLNFGAGSVNNQFIETDYLEVTLTGAAGQLPTPINAYVELIGFYTD